MQQTTAFIELAHQVLDGRELEVAEALDLLDTPDDRLLELLAAAFEIRRHYYGKQVKLNYLVNAKSGLCPEDCKYCSQAKGATSEIEKYSLLSTAEMVARAEQAVRNGASTCCLVISGRGPSKREVQTVSDATREIKQRWPGLKICACLGILQEGQAEQLRSAGVDRYNHNLNTAEEHYQKICSTHTYQQRVETVEAAKTAGISPCSGLIVGMQESPTQLINALFALRAIQADSVPINFLVPIPGTALAANAYPLTPQYCLKVLCVARFVCPTVEIRCSAGREKHLRTLQPLSLYPANSWFVSDYLTTPGQAEELDHQMIRDAGFEIEAIPEHLDMPARATCATTSTACCGEPSTAACSKS
jgi:biotin synthase